MEETNNNTGSGNPRPNKRTQHPIIIGTPVNAEQKKSYAQATSAQQQATHARFDNGNIELQPEEKTGSEGEEQLPRHQSKDAGHPAPAAETPIIQQLINQIQMMQQEMIRMQSKSQSDQIFEQMRKNKFFDKFSGDSKDKDSLQFEIYVQKMESHYRNGTDLKDVDKTQFDEYIGMVVQQTLSGTADQWYYTTYGKALIDGDKPPNWAMVKAAMNQRFGSKQKLESKQIEFINSKQKNDDDLESYITKFLNGENDCRKLNWQQYTMLKFKTGLTSEIIRSHIALKKPNTLMAMIEEARVAQAEIDIKPKTVQYNQVSQSEEEKNGVTKIAKEGAAPKRVRCPHCGFSNHAAENCYKKFPEKRPSYYKQSKSESKVDIEKTLANLQEQLDSLKA